MSELSDWSLGQEKDNANDFIRYWDPDLEFPSFTIHGWKKKKRQLIFREQVIAFVHMSIDPALFRAPAWKSSCSSGGSVCRAKSKLRQHFLTILASRSSQQDCFRTTARLTSFYSGYCSSQERKLGSLFASWSKEYSCPQSTRCSHRQKIQSGGVILLNHIIVSFMKRFPNKLQTTTFWVFFKAVFLSLEKRLWPETIQMSEAPECNDWSEPFDYTPTKESYSKLPLNSEDVMEKINFFLVNL